MLFPQNCYVEGVCLLGSCLLVCFNQFCCYLVCCCYTWRFLLHYGTSELFFLQPILLFQSPSSCRKFWSLVSLAIPQFDLELVCSAIAAGINGLSLQIG